jgi:glycerate kinase
MPEPAHLNILIAPDSFKGTLAALPVAQAIAAGIRQALPQAKIQLLPLADGGEGTLDAVLYATAGERRSAAVSDALGAPMCADYGVIGAGADAIAVLEAAQVVGLNQAGSSDVAQRSTRGLGELLRHCLDCGLRRFMIGLGGSSTNDGGAGLLAALGVALCDARGVAIAPTPQGLAALHHIAWEHLDPRLAQCQITLLTDVDIPLCGAAGATAMFGPQKGVRAEDVALFDVRLQGLARLGDAWAKRALSREPGAGAAGGLGYALLLCGAQRRSGAEALCELMQLDQALAQADWVITGEGKSDAQTLHGKLPWVVAQHARRAQVPVLLLSGSIEAASRAALAQVFTACYALVGDGVTQTQAMQDTPGCLSQRARKIAQQYLGPGD